MTLQFECLQISRNRRNSFFSFEFLTLNANSLHRVQHLRNANINFQSPCTPMKMSFWSVISYQNCFFSSLSQQHIQTHTNKSVLLPSTLHPCHRIAHRVSHGCMYRTHFFFLLSFTLHMYAIQFVSVFFSSIACDYFVTALHGIALLVISNAYEFISWNFNMNSKWFCCHQYYDIFILYLCIFLLWFDSTFSFYSFSCHRCPCCHRVIGIKSSSS